MSYSVKLEKLAREKQKSREIVDEIMKFGVTEQQKLDIIFNLSLTLESNQLMKDINEILKKYRETINKDEETDNNISDNDKPKIILE
tara:strand:+ start:2684 stop:2944 length:261 start_codon:yes stop_codon:yes gene_type:complete